MEAKNLTRGSRIPHNDTQKLASHSVTVAMRQIAPLAVILNTGKRGAVQTFERIPPPQPVILTWKAQYCQ